MKEKVLRWLPSNDSLKKPSVVFLLFTMCFSYWLFDFWTPYNAKKHENSFHYDAFNYYSYLPAIFLNKGSFEFEKKIPSGYNPVGPKNTYMPKTTYGMALMYSPFFAIACKIAYNSEKPVTGFTDEFAYMIHGGSIFYLILGLFFLRKFLLSYFNETVTTITLFAILFGTMLFMYGFVSNEGSHGYLFFLFSLFLFLTKKWHEEITWARTLGVGFVIALISLIRPTEILFFLVFLFWGVKSTGDFKSKLSLIWKHYPHFLAMALIGVLVWLPQFLFWKEHAGTYFYFSYPGEQFFWGDPQIINILFSYRKGWIIYTPLVLLAFVGFFFVKAEFPLSKAFFLFFTSLIVYILSCWWDWFFGGCFGARGFCQHIAYLSIPIAFAVDAALYSPSKFLFKGVFSYLTLAFIFSCVSMNLGQTMQYMDKKIHPFAMSEKVYWELFRTYRYDERWDEFYWGNIDAPDYDKLRSGEDRDQ